MYRLLMTIIVLVFSYPSYGFERVVILAPAAGDIFIQLGQQDKVVGVTRNNTDFPAALKVGSHIKPNIELIKSLAPDLIVIGSERFFSQDMSDLIDAKTVTYNPGTLDAIQEQIHQFGVLLDCQNSAVTLNHKLLNLLQQIAPLNSAPSVIYEVSQTPLTIAGKGNIVSDIIRQAGGQLLAPSMRKLIKFNTESLLVQQPDYYLYQVGPMNQNPQPPEKRPLYQLLHSQYLQVDQLRFSRANTQSFLLAVELNAHFQQLMTAAVMPTKPR